MTKKDKVKIGVLIFVGFLTLIMSYILPVEGGGASLIFVLTVPINIGVSIVISGVYYWLTISGMDKVRDIIYYSILVILLLLTFLFFPYKNASII
ncbi:hypothetical protein [Botryobacter ruber]|uniref:hypothetical protein n=1 Tax=Botryobacter ruber TaxID=2171629 RepID=UPI000F650F4E|nr:hypothetical protein [Botryobacter ruber]